MPSLMALSYSLGLRFSEHSTLDCSVSWAVSLVVLTLPLDISLPTRRPFPRLVPGAISDSTLSFGPVYR